MKKNVILRVSAIIMCMFVSTFLCCSGIQADSIDTTEDNTFIEDHKDELRTYNNEFSDDLDEREILIWTYPFSGETVDKITTSFGKLDYQYLYMDKTENEHLWGYIEDGEHTGWICFNEPNNPNLQKSEMIAPNASNTPVLKKDNKQQNAVVLVSVLVLLLVAGTAVVIAKFLKKNK